MGFKIEFFLGTNHAIFMCYYGKYAANSYPKIRFSLNNTLPNNSKYFQFASFGSYPWIFQPLVAQFNNIEAATDKNLFPLLLSLPSA